MDMSNEKEIGRRLRDAAQELGFEMPPDGFRMIVPLEDDDNTVVVHAVFIARGETLEEALITGSESTPGDDQAEIDAMFEAIIQGDKRDEVRQRTDEKVAEVTEDIIAQLKNDLNDDEGGFL
jgi:predicted RNase H-like HicB family nuclease